MTPSPDLRVTISTALTSLAALVLGLLGITDTSVVASVQAMIPPSVALVLAVSTWQLHQTHRATTVAAVQAAAIQQASTTTPPVPTPVPAAPVAALFPPVQVSAQGVPVAVPLPAPGSTMTRTQPPGGTT